MIRAAIFDLDGTLVDALEGHILTLNEAFRAKGFREYGKKEIAKYYGQTLEEIIRQLLKKPHIDKDVQDIARLKYEFYLNAKGAYVKALPGAPELVRTLYDRKIPMAVASSARQEVIEEALNKTGIAGYISAIVSSRDVKNSKPHPEIFLKAAEKLGVPPKNCVVFEDSPWGVLAAKRVGMKVVAVATGTTPKRELKKLKPDMVIGTMKEILQNLDGFLTSI